MNGRMSPSGAETAFGEFFFLERRRDATRSRTPSRGFPRSYVHMHRMRRWAAVVNSF
jgi:hypothetical protein